MGAYLDADVSAGRVRVGAQLVGLVREFLAGGVVGTWDFDLQGHRESEHGAGRSDADLAGDEGGRGVDLVPRPATPSAPWKQAA